jgi:hypothetical protein
MIRPRTLSVLLQLHRRNLQRVHHLARGTVQQQREAVRRHVQQLVLRALHCTHDDDDHNERRADHRIAVRTTSASARGSHGTTVATTALRSENNTRHAV